jgi:hypothetical protein
MGVVQLNKAIMNQFPSQETEKREVEFLFFIENQSLVDKLKI